MCETFKWIKLLVVARTGSTRMPSFLGGIYKENLFLFVMSTNDSGVFRIGFN